LALIALVIVRQGEFAPPLPELLPVVDT
jgi:hypothetical protein